VFGSSSSGGLEILFGEEDRPRLDQVGHCWADLTPELVAWEGNDQILNGSDLGHRSVLALRLHCTRERLARRLDAHHPVGVN